MDLYGHVPRTGHMDHVNADRFQHRRYADPDNIIAFAQTPNHTTSTTTTRTRQPKTHSQQHKTTSDSATHKTNYSNAPSIHPHQHQQHNPNKIINHQQPPATPFHNFLLLKTSNRNKKNKKIMLVVNRHAKANRQNLEFFAHTAKWAWQLYLSKVDHLQGVLMLRTRLDPLLSTAATASGIQAGRQWRQLP